MNPNLKWNFYRLLEINLNEARKFCVDQLCGVLWEKFPNNVLFFDQINLFAKLIDF